MNAMWGVHNDTLTTQLITGGFISIGWDPLPDLRSLGSSREQLKQSLARYYEDRKPMTLAAWAGTLLRFRDEMTVGDIVVAPYRPDSTVNIGLITSGYYFEAGAPEHRHRRTIEWKRLGIPRASLSEQARFEIGSLLTVFAVRKNVDEFRAVLNSTESLDENSRVALPVHRTDDDSNDTSQVRATRVAQYTRDFVLDCLLTRLSHQEFEEFTADLLRAIGYRARTTSYSGDGGVDVIAHKDALGVEPNLIKVQCKHTLSTLDRPVVQALGGTLAAGELGVLVSLGAFSTGALNEERGRPQLRLLGGQDVVDLTLEHYTKLTERWRRTIPLVPLLVVGDE